MLMMRLFSYFVFLLCVLNWRLCHVWAGNDHPYEQDPSVDDNTAVSASLGTSVDRGVSTLAEDLSKDNNELSLA